MNGGWDENGDFSPYHGVVKPKINGLVDWFLRENCFTGNFWIISSGQQPHGNFRWFQQLPLRTDRFLVTEKFHGRLMVLFFDGISRWVLLFRVEYVEWRYWGIPIDGWNGLMALGYSGKIISQMLYGAGIFTYKTG